MMNIIGHRDNDQQLDFQQRVAKAQMRISQSISRTSDYIPHR